MDEANISIQYLISPQLEECLLKSTDLDRNFHLDKLQSDYTRSYEALALFKREENNGFYTI